MALNEYRIKITLDWTVEEESYSSAESLARYYAEDFADTVMDDSTVTGEPVYAVSGSSKVTSLEVEKSNADATTD